MFTSLTVPSDSRTLPLCPSLCPFRQEILAHAHEESIRGGHVSLPNRVKCFCVTVCCSARSQRGYCLGTNWKEQLILWEERDTTVEFVKKGEFWDTECMCACILNVYVFCILRVQFGIVSQARLLQFQRADRFLWGLTKFNLVTS